MTIKRSRNRLIYFFCLFLFLPCWHWERVPAGPSFSQRFSPSVTATYQNHPPNSGNNERTNIVRLLGKRKKTKEIMNEDWFRFTLFIRRHQRGTKNKQKHLTTNTKRIQALDLVFRGTKQCLKKKINGKATSQEETYSFRDAVWVSGLTSASPHPLSRLSRRTPGRPTRRGLVQHRTRSPKILPLDRSTL